MSAHYEKLKVLLRELFQMDQADLDFGIYRIMNAKRQEIEEFLEKDLLPQVKEELSRHNQLGSGAKEAELKEVVENAKKLGVNPDNVPRVMELRDELKQGGDLKALEGEVFSELYKFFSRYYDGGDFLSLRRYKEGVYAIPYEGEEVKLYWANHDQYYIKSSEYLRNYSFKLRDDRRVHFRLVEADLEKENNKPQAGKERRFVLAENDPVLVENGELSIRFLYVVDVRRQGELNETAAKAILGNATIADWINALSENRATEKNPGRTLLEKHLADFTARYNFDYFIHKDLGGFLRRELDFYIKNEIMHLDDIESDAVPKVELYLSKIKALRKIAHKVIAFLEQLENFQKKLWLKKKFVVETNYCVTLDRVAEELYPEIVQNQGQIEEWKSLFAIEQIEKSTINPGYSEPLTVAFLKANPHLVLDTAWFSAAFKTRFLSSPALLGDSSSLEEAVCGVLIHSDNFQAANLLQQKYRSSVDVVYTDPPYNTSEFSFVYKNNYKHSSWVSMIYDRVSLCRSLLAPTGVLGVAIDDAELHNLRHVCSQVFGSTNWLSTIAVEVNPAGQNLRPNVPARSHDYCLYFAADVDEAALLIRELTDEEKAQYSEKDEKGFFLWDNLRRRGGNSRPNDRPRQFYPLFGTKDSVRVPQMHWNEDAEKWELLEAPTKGEIEMWPVDPKGEMRIWRLSPEAVRKEILSGDVSITEKAGRLEVIKKSRMPVGKKPKTLWTDSRYSATTYGTKLLVNILGHNSFSYPKSLFLVEDCLRYWLPSTGTAVDVFGGSGTTAHAVIEMNRDDDGSRKYILAEVAAYFRTVLLPRVKKIIYSREWKNGKPVGRDGSSHVLKYLRLESYEDSVNNLDISVRTDAQQQILQEQPSFREDYTLRYMLDVETSGSASLLNVQKFVDPFSYKLKVSTGTVGEMKEVHVDLVETFNWLIGLKVKHIDDIRGVHVVEGTNSRGERVLILWRKLDDVNNDKLNDWFKAQKYNTRDQEHDLIYVNGDNNLENFRRDDQTWKVRLIEEDFHKLMWECQDV